MGIAFLNYFFSGFLRLHPRLAVHTVCLQVRKKALEGLLSLFLFSSLGNSLFEGGKKSHAGSFLHGKGRTNIRN